MTTKYRPQNYSRVPGAPGRSRNSLGLPCGLVFLTAFRSRPCGPSLRAWDSPHVSLRDYCAAAAPVVGVDAGESSNIRSRGWCSNQIGDAAGGGDVVGAITACMGALVTDT